MITRLADPRPESSELQTEGPTPARLWGDQWLRVSEKVIKGLSIELTDRVATLEALANHLERTGESPSGTSLSAEIAKLGKVLQLFRLMPAEPFVTTEAVRLQDIIPRVVDMHSHHVDLSTIKVDYTAPNDLAPVLVRPSALLRCLLVLLESSAGNALRSATPLARIDLTCHGDGEFVVVRMEGPAPEGTLLFTGDGSLVYAVRSALAHAHGTADTEMLPSAPQNRLRYEVTLPTLNRARRLAQDGVL